MQRAGVPRVRKDEDAPCTRALLSSSEAGCVPAAARLPPGAVLALALERHGVAELRVGTAAAAAEPGGGLRRRGDEGGRAGGASPEPFFSASLVVGSLDAAFWLSVSMRPSQSWLGRPKDHQRRFEAGAAARRGQKVGPL